MNGGEGPRGDKGGRRGLNCHSMLNSGTRFKYYVVGSIGNPSTRTSLPKWVLATAHSWADTALANFRYLEERTAISESS
ncbi:hypothetical protein TorRG33x02_090550 [Trema orientale]|uniref:Uncharacterized protein n=1 Tax=Trema orientale TaxID=63057 RepID=A0A2P5FBJ5_TREOI|nr:hypothetical protein TorRG33x02_090550 [Trema orientale]